MIEKGRKKILKKTWHEGILGNIGVLGENGKQQKSQNPCCAANHTEKETETANAVLTPVHQIRAESE